jgi:hypothetical protein
MLSHEIVRNEASASMSVLTTVMYGDFPDSLHRIGLFGGSINQSAYISSTW